MKNLTIGTISENELLELAETIKLKVKLIAERKTIASNIKEKGRASCFISFFAHGFSRDLCEEQGDDTVGQLLQTASNKESEFILDKIYDSAISDLEIAISEYAVEQNSLIERDKVELTGRDLARAMLERGDKYVMCANQSAYDDWPRAIALNERGRMYYISGEYSYDANDSIYPINNQGEPLTQSEAGL